MGYLDIMYMPVRTETQIHYIASRELAARAEFSAKEPGAETHMGSYIMISVVIMI